MAFRFDADDETVQAGLRRIAQEQMDEALGAIRAAAQPPEKIVHQVRRSCKSLRALVRIVRPVFPRYALENQAFREIAHLLAGQRDAQVLAASLDQIAADLPDDEAMGRVRAALTGQSGETRPVEEVLDQCARLLQASRDRVALWTLHADGWEALEGGLAKTYRQARRAQKRLAKQDDATLSHEWRKHVKYHGFHTRLLRDIAPGTMRRRATKADKLADLLGDRHDLDLLADKRTALPWREAEAAAVDLLADKALAGAAALGRKARKRGARLFDEKPRKLASDWGKCWKQWVREAEPA